MIPALETCGLTKAFGRGAPVVDNLSLTVPLRSVYGFLGANGAGKTTTLKLALRLVWPDAGTIRLFGGSGPPALREVGSLIETPSLYDHLTGRETLDIPRRLLDLPAGE